MGPVAQQVFKTCAVWQPHARSVRLRRRSVKPFAASAKGSRVSQQFRSHGAKPRPGAVVVECTGEHDLATSESLGRLLTELVATNDLVVIDVSDAEFIDSSFLHNLVKADRLARPRGTRLRLQFGTAPVVVRALEMSGILNRIEHAPTREEAIAPFRSGGT